MIISYSPKFKEAVINMITEENGSFGSYELYLFKTFGEAFAECSFLYVKGGSAVGFIGVISAAESKALFIYSLCISGLYKNAGIDKMLIERVILYANKNRCNTISFLLNSVNRRYYYIFSNLAKRLNRRMKRTNRYEEAVFLEITYTIFLNEPPGEENFPEWE
ncbi:MAG: GNAT family N-acetyltransferase [Clostridiales bacterium]|nr:GNAT family N-acetyltransferase [Clostridiales bacterium]